MLRGRKKRIEADSQSVLHCPRNNSFEDWAVDFHTWVCIAFNEKGFELATDIEIQSIELKIVLPSLGVHELKRCSQHLSGDLFHLRQDLRLKAVMLMRKCGIKVPLELTVR